MKGKKFNAAEKHFEEKHVKLEKENKSLREQLVTSIEGACSLKEKAERLELENDALQYWIERLLEYTELSKEDIKAACERDKHLGNFMGLLAAFSGKFGTFIK